MSLLEQINNAGIIGAGGAGFPTHIKVNCQADTIIVNGAECEPLLRVDQQLMALYAKELAEALEMLRSEIGAGRAVFALKGKYHDAMDALRSVTASYPKLEVFELDNFYPAGDEQITVYEVTGRIMPEGSIPISVGVVVVNVETLLNIYNASKGTPVTHKYMTVTGEVRTPVTLKVPLGITYREAVKLAGGATVADPVYIDGGPMMGKYNEDLDRPVTKTSKGIILLARDHPWVIYKNKSLSYMLKEAQTCCCHCMQCTEVCPRHLIGHGLSPDRLMRIASYGSMCTNDEAMTSAFLCSECGACGIGCNMGLQPFKLNHMLKQELGAKGIRNPHHEQPEAVDMFRFGKKMSIATILRKSALSGYDRPAPMDESGYDASRVTIPLKQHIGAPAVPVVKAGDRVGLGDMVAKPAEKGPCVPYHASISGVVTAVTDQEIVIENRQGV